MSLKKTYYPSKRFDDDLVDFADLCKAKGWSFPSVGIAQLVQDALDQRHERAMHSTIESQYFNMHEAFGLAQEARYERFSGALGCLRAMFRKDKAIQAELKRFKRVVRRKTPEGEVNEPQDE